MTKDKHHLETADAEYLADAVIEQFRFIPFSEPSMRMKIPRDNLVAMLTEIPVWDSETRMQFKVPHDEKKYTFEDGINSLYLRRIITNYDTQWKPPVGVRLWQKAEEKVLDYDVSKWNSKVICRRLRQDPEISKIRKRVFESGDKLGLFCKFGTSLEIKDEYHGGDVRITHIPLIFIPGATKEDLDTLAKFCIEYQYPTQSTLSYVKHGVFEDRLYEGVHAIFKSKK